MVWCLLLTKKEGTLDHGGGELVGENFMVGQIFEEFFEEEARQAPWMEGVQNLLAQIGSCVLWIPSTTNVPPLSSGNN